MGIAINTKAGASDAPRPTLKANAIGLTDSVVMALAGSAPAYSLTATTATLVATVGLAGPAVLLYAAIPMFGIALAFMYLNRWRSDAGATYTWIGRSLSPSLGFMAGWALLVSNALSMVSGSIPLGATTLHIIAPRLETNVLAATFTGVLWFIAVAVPLFFGIISTAKIQNFMTSLEVVGLLVLAGATLVKFAHHPVVAFSWHWFSLRQFPSVSVFMGGMLVAVFYYYGWDVSSNLAEESKNPKHNPGTSGVYGMVGLVVLFLLLQCVLQMGLTADQIAANPASLLPILGDMVLPHPFGTIVIIVVIVSSLATLETALLQSSRSLFAMGRDRVLGAKFAELHPKYQTPWLASIVTSLIALALFLLASFSPNIGKLMADLINAIGLQIVFYYALAGIACFWFYRHTHLKSVSNLLMQAVWPLGSALFLVAVGYYNIVSLNKQNGHVVWLSAGTILIGIVPLLYYRWLNKSAYYTDTIEAAEVTA